MTSSMFLSVLIFVITYLIIISEKVNRTIIVFIGLSMGIILHLIPFDESIKHIDINVIFLLLGMMIIVKVMEKSGIFEWGSIWGAKKVKADPVKILLLLFVITAVCSAFLDNVTTILLISPVSLLLATQLRINPLPFLITEILGSNIGRDSHIDRRSPEYYDRFCGQSFFYGFFNKYCTCHYYSGTVFHSCFLFFIQKKTAGIQY